MTRSEAKRLELVADCARSDALLFGGRGGWHEQAAKACRVAAAAAAEIGAFEVAKWYTICVAEHVRRQATADKRAATAERASDRRLAQPERPTPTAANAGPGPRLGDHGDPRPHRAAALHLAAVHGFIVVSAPGKAKGPRDDRPNLVAGNTFEALAKAGLLTHDTTGKPDPSFHAWVAGTHGYLTPAGRVRLAALEAARLTERPPGARR